jgi:hypothetical protein
MKRPASVHSLSTVAFAIPDSWTPSQAVAVVEMIDGLRELIWARYGLQLLDEHYDRYLHDAAIKPRRSRKWTANDSRNAMTNPGKRQAIGVNDDEIPF